MTDRFRRQTSNLLLSALVLAWGIVPPRIQHVHAGGSDATHRHDSQHEAAHHGSHDHGHDHDDGHGYHGHAAPPEVSLLGDYVPHLHWRFLGMEFTMPVSEQPPVVCVMNEIVPIPHVGPSFVRVLQAAIRAPSADVVWSLEPIPRASNVGTSIPLCDSARLERSGVLLA